MGFLKNLVTPSISIKVPGNDDPLVVRGLGADSIIYLMQTQREAMEAAFGMFVQAQKGSLTGEAVGSFITVFTNSFGPLVGAIIACGAGEPDQWEEALRLPLTVQIEAIEAIMRLTFYDQSAVEKLLETVTNMMSGIPDLPASQV